MQSNLAAGPFGSFADGRSGPGPERVEGGNRRREQEHALQQPRDAQASYWVGLPDVVPDGERWSGAARPHYPAPSCEVEVYCLSDHAARAPESPIR